MFYFIWLYTYYSSLLLIYKHFRIFSKMYFEHLSIWEGSRNIALKIVLQLKTTINPSRKARDTVTPSLTFFISAKQIYIEWLVCDIVLGRWEQRSTHPV